jgi:hypothetical protein
VATAAPVGIPDFTIVGASASSISNPALVALRDWLIEEADR